MRVKLVFIVFSLLSKCAIIAAIAATLLLTGQEERILLNYSGAILLLSTICSQKIKKNNSKSKSESENAQDLLDNFTAFLGIYSALVLGYFIFIAPDNFQNRKFYIVLFCVISLTNYIVSRLGSFLLNNIQKNGSK